MGHADLQAPVNCFPRGRFRTRVNHHDVPPRQLTSVGLNKLTGTVKPPRSGSGLSDRFDRKPVEIGGIQKRLFNRFRSAY